MHKNKHSRFEIDKAAGTLNRPRALSAMDTENKHRELKKAMDNSDPETAASRYLATPGEHPYDRVSRAKKVVAAVGVAGAIATGTLLGIGSMSEGEVERRDKTEAEQDKNLNTSPPEPGQNNAYTAVEAREAANQPQTPAEQP